MKRQTYDLIGDIHGQHGKLTALLHHLGYLPQGHTFRHPGGRKVIFLGDYIDRGPRIRETLHLVRGMVDAGDALAIMGNHEFNAVCYATPDGKGDYLRSHEPKNVKQHSATLNQFVGHEREWGQWLAWMKHLPFFLELGGMRAVHACWDAERMSLLHGRTLLDLAFLRAATTGGTAEFLAIENVLKGPELDLPEGEVLEDKEGVPRTKIRARWWNLRKGITFGEIAMPSGMKTAKPLTDQALQALPNYPETAAPVFCGHYWIPPTTPKQPLARNIACLDYCGALADHPLIAYRWDGEQVLCAKKFTQA